MKEVGAMVHGANRDIDRFISWNGKKSLAKRRSKKYKVRDGNEADGRGTAVWSTMGSARAARSPAANSVSCTGKEALWSTDTDCTRGCAACRQLFFDSRLPGILLYIETQ